MHLVYQTHKLILTKNDINNFGGLENSVVFYRLEILKR